MNYILQKISIGSSIPPSAHKSCHRISDNNNHRNNKNCARNDMYCYSGKLRTSSDSSNHHCNICLRSDVWRQSRRTRRNHNHYHNHNIHNIFPACHNFWKIRGSNRPQNRCNCCMRRNCRMNGIRVRRSTNWPGKLRAIRQKLP